MHTHNTHTYITSVSRSGLHHRSLDCRLHNYITTNQVFCFSTFFLSDAQVCLARRGHASDAELYARLKKWFPKSGSLFDRDFLVVPIHDASHWSACVVVNPRCLMGEANTRFVELRRKGSAAKQILSAEPQLADQVSE